MKNADKVSTYVHPRVDTKWLPASVCVRKIVLSGGERVHVPTSTAVIPVRWGERISSLRTVQYRVRGFTKNQKHEINRLLLMWVPSTGTCTGSPLDETILRTHTDAGSHFESARG